MSDKQDKQQKEFNPTPEEKAMFLMQNSKVTFWAEKETVKKFDEILKAMDVKNDNGSANRKSAIIKLMEKFIEKNKKYLN